MNFGLHIGAKVKRNPKGFPPGHMALKREGTIVALDNSGWRVQWDDSPDAKPYAYQDSELVIA